MKKLLSIILLSAMLLTFAACDSGDADTKSTDEKTTSEETTTEEITTEAEKVKTFTSNGLSVTLPEYFKKTSIQGFTVAFDSDDVGILALQEKFTLMQGLENKTLDEYGTMVLANNQDSNTSKLKKADGLTYFEHDFVNESNEHYYYVSYIYKADDAFWLIQFAALEENIAEYKPQFATWAKSVKFS